MPYNCGWGCTSYNPFCDACDSATTTDNPYHPEESEQLHKAALKGMTLQEWHNSEDEREE